MKKVVMFLSLFGSSLGAQASLSDCKDLYVGAITQQKGGVYVVLKDAQQNAGGSYAQNFTGWTEEDKSRALSILMAAKISNHRVNVATLAEGECSITQGGKTLKYVQLSSNP